MDIHNDIKETLMKLATQGAETSQALGQLSQLISKNLGSPLKTILNNSQLLHEKALPLREQREFAAKIQQAGNELQEFVTSLTNFNKQIQAQHQMADETINFVNLNGLRTLLISDSEQNASLADRLQKLGLLCNMATLDESLQVLQSAAHTDRPYQIAIVSQPQFDHHAAYLGRTLKANPLLHHVMPVLVVSTTKLLDFEIERAHFSGFACILNQNQPQQIGKKLATCWQNWSGKTIFTQGTIAAPNPNQKQRILIVDDEPTAQFVMRHQLNELGYNTDVAPNGETALKLLERGAYDLIFMDIGLPDISGLEVTAEIRRREHGQHHTPIIGLTVYSHEQDQENGLGVGMDSYLIKPLLKDRLENVLTKWIKTNN